MCRVNQKQSHKQHINNTNTNVAIVNMVFKYQFTWFGFQKCGVFIIRVFDSYKNCLRSLDSIVLHSIYKIQTIPYRSKSDYTIQTLQYLHNIDLQSRHYSIYTVQTLQYQNSLDSTVSPQLDYLTVQIIQYLNCLDSSVSTLSRCCIIYSVQTLQYLHILDYIIYSIQNIQYLLSVVSKILDLIY